MAKAKVRSIHELDATSLAVLQAARRLDRRGVFPTGDRLITEVEDAPEQDVRRARRDLVSWGLLRPATVPDGSTPEPEPRDDEVEEHGSAPLARDGAGRKPRDGADPSKTLNIALYRIVEGKGSVYKSLAAVMGITPNAVKCRVDDARWRYTSEDLEPDSAEFTAADLRYFRKLVARSKDAEVKAFAANVISPHRARPDKRSQSRDRPRSTREKLESLRVRLQTTIARLEADAAREGTLHETISREMAAA